MESTHLTLLQRLSLGTDERSWREFVEVYGPLLKSYARRRGAGEQEAEDVCQDVLGVVAAQVKSFNHSGRPGAFRAWLRRITIRKVAQLLADKHRQPGAQGGSAALDMMASLPDPSGDDVDEIWEKEWQERKLEIALRRTREEVLPHTWDVFELTVLNNVKPSVAAARLRMPLAKVYVYKSRVTQRVREAAARLDV